MLRNWDPCPQKLIIVGTLRIFANRTASPLLTYYFYIDVPIAAHCPWLVLAILSTPLTAAQLATHLQYSTVQYSTVQYSWPPTSSSPASPAASLSPAACSATRAAEPRPRCTSTWTLSMNADYIISYNVFRFSIFNYTKNTNLQDLLNNH